MNGMSYAANRWVWAMILLCSFILTREWEDLFKLSCGEKRCLLIGCTVLAAFCFLLNYSRTPGAFSMIVFLLAACIVILRQEGKAGRVQGQILMCLLIAAGAVNLAFWDYSPEGGGIAELRVENRKIEEEFFQNETKAVLKTASEDFTRYTGRNLTENASITTRLSGTQYYWSDTNPYMNQFRSDLELLEGMIHIIYGYDDRTALITLSGSGYYVTPKGDEEGLPYGFEKENEVNIQSGRTRRRVEELKKELGTDHLTREQEKRYTAIPMTSSPFIKINMRSLSDTAIINMFPRINGISSMLWRNSRLFSGLPVWKKLLRGCPDMMWVRWTPPLQSCRLKWSVKDLRSLTGTVLLSRPETM